MHMAACFFSYVSDPKPYQEILTMSAPPKQDDAPTSLKNLCYRTIKGNKNTAEKLQEMIINTSGNLHPEDLSQIYYALGKYFRGLNKDLSFEYFMQAIDYGNAQAVQCIIDGAWGEARRKSLSKIFRRYCVANSIENHNYLLTAAHDICIGAAYEKKDWTVFKKNLSEAERITKAQACYEYALKSLEECKIKTTETTLLQNLAQLGSWSSSSKLQCDRIATALAAAAKETNGNATQKPVSTEQDNTE
jgi:hypothetical protein